MTEILTYRVPWGHGKPGNFFLGLENYWNCVKSLTEQNMRVDDAMAP